MTGKEIMKIVRRYKKVGRQHSLRTKYLSTFAPKMVYRTTKTENNETTRRMVDQVLSRHK